MLVLETFETHFCAVMEALVEAAGSELRRLLTEGSVSAQQHSAAASGKRGEEAPPEERLQPVTHITDQFVSLMNACSRRVLEQILVMVKVSMCETRPAEQKDHDDGTSPKPSSTARRKPQNQPAANIWTDHVYCRVEQLTEGLFGAPVSSESELEPDESSYPEPEPGLSSGGGEKTSEQKDSIASEPPEKTVIKCPSCEKTFFRRCLMERHNLSHTKPHSCSKCGKAFATLSGLNAHSMKHSREKLYRCWDCGVGFAYRSTYKRHLRNHAEKKPTRHTCSLCDLAFADTRLFQRHRCEALRKTFRCCVCLQTFPCRQSLAHHEDLHSGDRGFVCETCGKGFLSSSSLATHRLTHILRENVCDDSDADVKGKRPCETLFSCEVCGKAVRHQRALKQHMLTHMGEKPYMCEVCGKRCSHASALENHMRVHTGRKPGQTPICGICGKIFSSQRRLRDHAGMHVREKSHACDQCEKCFRSLSALESHAAVHRDEERFRCDICRKRFAQVGSLKLHRRLHTGEHLFCCVVCGKRFQLRGEFRKHLSNHVPMETAAEDQT